MTTSTLALTEFLLARIAEDEAVAREAAESVKSHNWRVINVPHEGTWIIRAEGHYVPSDAGQDAEEEHAERHDPARVLAECEAKRRIVERATCDDAPDCGDHDCRVIDEDRHILASAYADHPQFQEEWRA